MWMRRGQGTYSRGRFEIIQVSPRPPMLGRHMNQRQWVDSEVQPMFILTYSSFQRCFSSTLLTTFPGCEFRTHWWMYFSGFFVKYALATSPLSTTFVKYRLLTESHLVYRPRSTSPLKGIYIPWTIHICWWPWWAIQPLNYIVLQALYPRTGPIPQYVIISIAIQWFRQLVLFLRFIMHRNGGRTLTDIH
jgi:hypothetical protein